MPFLWIDPAIVLCLWSDFFTVAWNITNLIVLEKDSMHQAEVSRYKEALNLHKAQISDLSNRLDSTQAQLQDQTEALEAAQRLTAQVERKEEAISALREEGEIVTCVWKLKYVCFAFAWGSACSLRGLTLWNFTIGVWWDKQGYHISVWSWI